MGMVLLLLGAVAVGTVEWVQENRVVGTTSDIFYAYLDARNDLPPLPLPMGAEDVLRRMEADDFSFLDDHWFINQSGSTLYVSEDSKLAKTLQLPLEILVVEDISLAEITIYSEDKKGNWKGLALFDAPPILDETSSFYATLSAKEKEQDLFLNLSATRVRWIVTLKPESNMWTDLVFQRDAVSMSLPEEGEMMAMMSVPVEHTNDIWISSEPVSNGLDVAVYCPSGVSNIEIYVSDDLISNVWTVAAENLSTANTNTAHWFTETSEVGFFRAGNTDVDSDTDDICDAREKYVHKTDPDDADTDGDNAPDGWEVAHTFDPLDISDGSADPDGDGYSNATEYINGADPLYYNPEPTIGVTYPQNKSMLP